MENRAFSKKCGTCRQRTMEIATFAYSAEYDHDGRKYVVRVPDLSAPKCANCGTLSFDRVAELRLETEFRKTLGLLLPAEIRRHRLSRGFSQQQLADLIGISVSTLSRWETGAQIQQRSLDKMLRLVFFTPDARAALESNFEAAPAASA